MGYQVVLIFEDLLVEAITARSIVVSWMLAPSLELIGNYRVKISRSLSPDSDFVDIETGVRANQFVYVDQDPPELSRWATLYYKVTAEQVDAGGVPIPATSSESEAKRLRQSYAPAALHIIKAREIYYKHLKIGRDSLVYRRRTHGQSCTECYDTVEQRATRHDCPVCFGTGRVGGYYSPIRVLVQYHPAERRNQVGSSITEPTYVMAHMGHFPLVSPRDVVFEISAGKWYLVNSVSLREVLRVTTSQHVQLRELDPQNKEQDLPLPSDVVVAADLHTSHLVSAV